WISVDWGGIPQVAGYAFAKYKFPGRNVLFVALLVPTLIVDNQGGDIKTLYGLPPILAGSLVIPLLTTALAAILIVFAVLAWKRRYWSLGERIHYTLVAAAAVAFVWSLACLNLIGFHY
ncbi:MAG: hypothetical protein M1553_06815, partial [Firmicutes bacterium]|nr:hypothetical protein [Bacillota bacterium]